MLMASSYSPLTKISLKICQSDALVIRSVRPDVVTDVSRMAFHARRRSATRIGPGINLFIDVSLRGVVRQGRDGAHVACSSLISAPRPRLLRERRAHSST